jgi:hypothetical protein
MLIDHVRTGKPAISVEVVRLDGPWGEVPVVAARCLDGIELYYGVGDSWQSTRVEGVDAINTRIGFHSSLAQSEGPLYGLCKDGGCNRIGLAAGDNRVFLVYEKTDDHCISIDVFTATDRKTLRRYEEGTATLGVPQGTGGRLGYYLWAGFSEDFKRLLILAQTYPEVGAQPLLTLFSTETYGSVKELTAPHAWTKLDIGTGGYDLSARLIGVDIHCIFREEEYPVTFSFGPGGGADEYGRIDVSHAEYAPLTYVKVNLPEQAVYTRDGLPGGEHPQIHSPFPLAYTADRLSAGSIASDSEGLSYEVETSRKHLFLWDEREWKDTRLMEISETELGWFRQRESTISGYDEFRWSAEPIFHRPPGAGNLLQIARPHSLLPVYSPRFTWSPEDGLNFDLVHQRSDIQALVMTRIRHDPRATPGDDPDLNRYAVLNINHENIRPPTEIAPAAGAENGQFEVFSLRSGFTQQEIGSGHMNSWSARQGIDVINSSGGDLSADGLDTEKPTLVFVHPGDGGVRVLWDFEVARVTPVENEAGSMEPDAVVGDGTGAWIDVAATAADGWRSFGLPVEDATSTINQAYMRTHFTGLDKQILDLFAIASTNVFTQITISDDDKKVYVQEPVGYAEDSDLAPIHQEIWDQLWAVQERIVRGNLLSSAHTITVEFSDYTITWNTPIVAAPGLWAYVLVQLRSSYLGKYRLIGAKAGQGRIKVRLPIRVETPCALAGYKGVTMGWVSLSFELGYDRLYTPAVLTRDIRGEDPDRSDAADALVRDDETAILTAKPVGDSSVQVVGDPQVHFTLLKGKEWDVTVLSAAGSLLVAAGAAAAGAALLLAAAGGIVAFFVIQKILRDTLPGIVEDHVREKIHEADFKTMLDESGLLRNAGEGVAEAIAYAALSQNERRITGLNRYLPGIWKMVHVQERLCRVLRR